MQGSTISIPCPRCLHSLGEADTNIRLLRFRSITCCECGFAGAYDWVIPHLGISAAEAIAQLEHRKTACCISDNEHRTRSPEQEVLSA